MRTLLLLTLLLATQAAHAFYDSSNGKWINRDPIGEDGGVNLNGFVSNQPIGSIDPLGLDVYFAIYYNNTASDASGAFRRAAETWKRDVWNRPDYSTCDIVLLIGASSESDFASSWTTVKSTAESMSMKVKEGVIFSHATPGSLEWKGSSFTQAEAKALPALPWVSGATLSLQGCNTSVGGLGSCAAGFSSTQGVLVEAQPGYSYFSEQLDKYVRIDTGGIGTSGTVYLRAYKRGKNSWFGDGGSYPPVLFPPTVLPQPPSKK